MNSATSGKATYSGIDREKAVFTEGSTMRHVLAMTSTGAVGLVAIFFVDIINLFYISLLGEQELAAAVGYASTIMFFSVSISIGFSIAATAITARAIGAGNQEEARSNAGASLIYMTGMCVLLTIMLYPLLGPFVDLIGAVGETREIALEFMQIALPSFPLLGLGMCAGSLLRARGDAKRAMYVTLSSGMAALFIDPLLIFGLDLGVNGAAYSIVLVRVLMVAVGLWGVLKVHRMVNMPGLGDLLKTVRPFLVIAIPAVLTQVATPIGNAYVTAAIAPFGDDAVAGWAIVGRMVPLAFAATFALSGAVGPILSQNYGANRLDRVNQTMRDSLIFSLVYSVAIWAILALFYPQITDLFQARNDAASMIRFFCLFVAGSFIFNSALFVANAAFNNLGFPVLSTAFNWGRATLGVIPFVWIGQRWGAEGILAGWGVGGILFGLLSVIVCFRLIRNLPGKPPDDEPGMRVVPTSNSPFTSGRGASA